MHSRTYVQQDLHAPPSNLYSKYGTIMIHSQRSRVSLLTTTSACNEFPLIPAKNIPLHAGMVLQAQTILPSVIIQTMASDTTSLSGCIRCAPPLRDCPPTPYYTPCNEAMFQQSITYTYKSTFLYPAANSIEGQNVHRHRIQWESCNLILNEYPSLCNICSIDSTCIISKSVCSPTRTNVQSTIIFRPCLAGGTCILMWIDTYETVCHR